MPGALCGGFISVMRPAVLFAEEAAVKVTALNSPCPHLLWFYQWTKSHSVIHCVGVYNIMLFTDGCAV